MNYSNQMSTNQFNKTTVVLQFSYFEEIDSHRPTNKKHFRYKKCK